MTHDPSIPVILVVGPDPSLLGGMATVMRQMMEMELPAGWRINIRTFTCSPGPTERWRSRILRHLRQFLRLARHIRRERVAIVHLHTCSGATFWRTAADAMLARLMRARVVLHLHGAMFDEYVASSRWLTRWLIRRALERADAVVALSTGWATKVVEIAPRARVVVIPNAIDVGPPSVSRTTRTGTDASRPCRMLMLARMDLWKGVNDLLSTCELLLRDGIAFELVLAGPEGSAGNAAELTGRIAALGLAGCVRYAGPVEGERKEQLLRWADVLVQPSHHEGLPISVLEGMARGLAIVATRVGAVPEVLTGELAQGLVDACEPRQLATALSRLCRDADLRRRLGDLGAEGVRERFSLDRFRQALASLYGSLLARNRDSHRSGAMLAPAKTG